MASLGLIDSNGQNPPDTDGGHIHTPTPTYTQTHTNTKNVTCKPFILGMNILQLTQQTN